LYFCICVWNVFLDSSASYVMTVWHCDTEITQAIRVLFRVALLLNWRFHS
jgi:hypothetical protein